MRWFGILLIVFNVAAGAGFVYLSTQDWKGRQTINAAGVRHILVLTGLPVDPPPGAPEGFDPEETPFILEMGGGESTKTISQKLLESYFTTHTKKGNADPPAATDPPLLMPSGKIPLSVQDPVTHQIAEVKRVQAIIKAELDKEIPAAETLTFMQERIGLLRGWLLNQAETIDVRVEYLALLSPTDAAGQPKTVDRLKADATKLRELLDARFAAVLAKPARTENPVDPGEKTAPDYAEKKLKIDAMPEKDRLAKSAEWRAAVQDDTQRRMLIAHLLVHLEPDANWQKRVMIVVGLRRYVKAVSLQVVRFADMTNQIERYVPNDQAAFTKHENQLRDRAIRNAERARAVAEIRVALNAQKIAKDDAVNRQRTQLKLLTDQLTKLKNEVDEKLVRQTEIETELFETQREVALTLEEVDRLEALRAAVERERHGLLPQTK